MPLYARVVVEIVKALVVPFQNVDGEPELALAEVTVAVDPVDTGPTATPLVVVPVVDDGTFTDVDVVPVEEPTELVVAGLTGVSDDDVVSVVATELLLVDVPSGSMIFPQFGSVWSTRATYLVPSIGPARLRSTRQLSRATVGSKTTPTQAPAPWLAFRVSQRLAQVSGLVLVSTVSRKLLSSYVRPQMYL